MIRRRSDVLYRAAAVQAHDLGQPMFTSTFWERTTERVVSSSAEVALAGLTLSQNWRFDLALAGLAALYAALKCLAAGRVGDRNDPAFLPESRREP